MFLSGSRKQTQPELRFDSSHCFCVQEPTGEKTNNGIHYKLQLLYSNGGRACFIAYSYKTIVNHY